ncbi:hypothetical protein BS78_10G201400 [Paspalum vaginatum]|nr:hypothetical protein BS78_10G201400 [Paspalum vaginatum]
MARVVAGGLMRPRAPPAVFVAALLLLVLASSLPALADASRPLKQLPSSSEGSAGGAARSTAESPPGYIDTVVGGGAGGGHHRLMSIGMLRGIKDSGPSPGAGH